MAIVSNKPPSSSPVQSNQQGFVSSTSLSTGSGRDAKYLDVTITAVSDVDKCTFHTVGSFSQASQTDGAYAMDLSYQAAPVAARLTSTTNLRLSTPQAAMTRLNVTWQVLELK